MKRILLTTTLLFLMSFVLVAQTPGELWGVAPAGGPDQLGVIYKTNADGTNHSVQYNFTFGNPGGRPYYTTPIQASNGKIYGLTTEGGTSNLGVLFEYDPATSTYTRKVDFNAEIGSQPFGNLIQATDGKLYGMTRYGGANGSGTIFQYDIATNVHTKKFDFSAPTSGAEPNGSLVQLANGKMYGMARLGGANGTGVIFEYDPATNTFTKKRDFGGVTDDGAEPLGHLTLAGNNKLYGMTWVGGTSSMGTIFEYDPSTNQYVKRFDFPLNNVGQMPQGSLFKAASGKLYGMTQSGGAGGGGTIFEYDVATNVCTKKFDLNNTNGSGSYGNITQAPNGKLWGLTYSGGIFGGGVLFEYDVATNTYTKKFQFGGSLKNGNNPGGTPLIASNGKVYGTTLGGGDSQAIGGTFFEFNPADNQFKSIHLRNLNNGASPNGSLVYVNGKFYGMTDTGGDDDEGTGVLFQYDPVAKTVTAKHAFDDADGTSPNGNTLMLASNGKLYGTTYRGGSANTGVLFEYDPTTDVFTKKSEFTGANGRYPSGQLVQARNGKLYGTTYTGGVTDLGVIFEYDFTGTHAVKYEFSTNGALPTGGMTLASNNKLYGLVETGGATFKGAIYEFDPATNNYTKKYDLTTDAYKPGPSMMLADNTKMYGLTRRGGTADRGILFEYDVTTNAFAKKLDIGTGNDLDESFATLTQSCNGKLYGFTNTGGSKDSGALFEFDPATGAFAKKKDLDEQDGIYPRNGALTSWPVVLPQPVITSDNSNPAKPILTSSGEGNQWYKNDVMIPSATSKTFTVSEAGTYKVQSTVNLCISKFSATVAYIVTGLEDSPELLVSVYPNPAKEDVYVDLSGFNKTTPVSIKVLDMLGRNMFTGAGIVGEPSRIDIRKYEVGQYIILMQQDARRVSKKIIKSF